MGEERITVVGLGKAGIQIVDAMLREGDLPVTAIVVDSDKKVLSAAAAVQRRQIGKARTQGCGTGGDVALARACAEEDLSALRELFSGVDLVILICGMGGGMAGAAPALLEAARREGALTLCFGILPAAFEGRSRRDTADAAIAALRPCSDAIILAPNDRLLDHVAEQNLAKSFALVDNLIACAVRGVWQLLAKPGFISLSFADLQKVARAGGALTFSFGEGRGRARTQTAVDALLSCPTLEGGRVLREARSVLVSIAGGSGLTLKEVGGVMDAISESVGGDTEVVMGTVLDEAWGNRVSVTVVVAGPDAPPEEEPEVEQAGEPIEETKPQKQARRRKRRDLQAKLRLDTAGKGRFKDIEPTIMDGEDLDIPTFIRRNLPVDR